MPLSSPAVPLMLAAKMKSLACRLATATPVSVSVLPALKAINVFAPLATAFDWMSANENTPVTPLTSMTSPSTRLKSVIVSAPELPA